MTVPGGQATIQVPSKKYNSGGHVIQVVLSVLHVKQVLLSHLTHFPLIATYLSGHLITHSDLSAKRLNGELHSSHVSPLRHALQFSKHGKHFPNNSNVPVGQASRQIPPYKTFGDLQLSQVS